MKLKWTKIASKLPAADADVLIFDGKAVNRAKFKPFFYTDGNRITGITHWADIPEPPDENE